MKQLIEIYKNRKRKYASKEEIQKRIAEMQEIEQLTNLTLETRNWATIIINRLKKLL